MNRVTMSGNDGLWARIRAALTRGAQIAEPPYGQAAFASNPNKKSRLAQRIDEELRRGWAYCAERKLSLCVLALEIDGYAEYFAAYGREAVEEAIESIETSIGAQLTRQADVCLRSGQTGFMLVLPDMPALMARDLASRIAAALRREGIPNRESHAGQVTLSTGIAVVNPQGKMDRAVLNAATQAVKKAQRRGLARLEVVDLRSREDKRRRAA
ncbi:diguanylate cyclase [uncultured Devosia sp.]|uniref:diguanylate cyclase domain-containing protein n=1 Tax=uncultured Devosia sp. TaxID=211434 RepID=UPI002634B59D|nr:diguanylate cyclase [uncultured Devosia sp.]